MYIYCLLEPFSVLNFWKFWKRVAPNKHGSQVYAMFVYLLNPWKSTVTEILNAMPQFIPQKLLYQFMESGQDTFLIYQAGAEAKA